MSSSLWPNNYLIKTHLHRIQELLPKTIEEMGATLVHSRSYHKISQSKYLQSNENVFLLVLKVQKSKIKAAATLMSS